MLCHSETRRREDQCAEKRQVAQRTLIRLAAAK
jgi:hypothetical protein